MPWEPDPASHLRAGEAAAITLWQLNQLAPVLLNVLRLFRPGAVPVLLMGSTIRISRLAEVVDPHSLEIRIIGPIPKTSLK